jgi:hypothetical protein
MSLSDPNVWPFSASGCAKHTEVTCWRVEHLNCVYPGQWGYVGIGIGTQHKDTPHEHAGMLSLDGGMQVMEGLTIVTCLWQCQGPRMVNVCRLTSDESRGGTQVPTAAQCICRGTIS